MLARFNTFLFLLTAGFFVLSCSNAYSQALDPNTNPGQLSPGQIERRFQPPELPKSGGDPIIPEIEEGAEVEGGENIRFVFRGFVFEGMNAYDSDAFKDLYAQRIGKEITLANIFEITAAITARYRNDGYILSRAILPPQRIADGLIRVQIIEGFIDEITYDGVLLRDTSILEEYKKILEKKIPLRAEDLERFVLLTNDLPGASARVVLLPSSATVGASDLLVVMDQDDYETNLSLDNRGSRYVGPFQVSASTTANSFLDNYQQLGLRYISTAQARELQLGELSYAAPLSHHGDKAEFSITRSLVHPGHDLVISEIASNSTSVSASYTYPYIRSREENLSFTASFDYRDSMTTILSSLLSEDRLRSLKLEANYDFVGLGAVNLIGASVTQGLDVINAKTSGSDFLSRQNGRSDFTRFNMNVLRLQGLSESWSLYLAANAQYSLSQLLSSEEFGFGGSQFGRAYDPSELTGDHGIAALAEIRYNTPVNNHWLKSYELYGFYDFGNVWKIDDNQIGQDTSLSGSSAGGGIRLSMQRGVSTSLEVAQPLTRVVGIRSSADPDKGDDPRAFISVILSF